MNITDIRIRKIFKKNKRLKAIVSITIEDSFAIHNIALIRNGENYHISMPFNWFRGRKVSIAHPVNELTRKTLETIIIDAYNKHLDQQQSDEAV